MGSINKQSSSPKSFIIQSTDSSDNCPAAALIEYLKVRPPNKACSSRRLMGPLLSGTTFLPT